MKQNGGPAVDSLERFDFEGSTQWALVRGRRWLSPVLLLVQAGPGFPMIHEARALEQALHLEDRFRVVYWDQRGTGKSFSPAEGTGRLRVDDLIGDVHAMVGALRTRLEVEQVHVVGFSFGGSIAAVAAALQPAFLRSLTLVGPDVDLVEAEQFAYAFALAEAERRGHRRALRALRDIGPPPHVDAKRFLARIKWVTNFGGIDRRATFGKLVRAHVWRLFASPHYSLAEVARAIRGMSVTQGRLLADLQRFNLLARASHLRVPVAVFQGRRDVAAPPKLTLRYYEGLAAPQGKELVWFEDSAHMPHVEEPDRFRLALIDFTSRGHEPPLAE